jgi:hypothetical protein
MAIKLFDFPTSARATFSFLEIEFEFRVTEHDAAAVRYESDQVFVEVSCELLAIDVAEIAVTIGLLDQSRRDRTGYSINHLKRLAVQNDNKRYHWPKARTQNECDAGLEKLATELRAHGSRALRGDVNVFNAMFTAAEIARGSIGVDFVRQKAEAAFREKAYSKAVMLYESIEGHRTSVDEGKLAYARNHCESDKH